MSDRESFLEKKFRKYVEDDGGKCVKIKDVKGWPDRVTLPPVPMGIIWIEFKKKGLKAKKIQEHIHNQLKELGHVVYVADNYEQAIQVYEEYKRVYSARLSGRRDTVPFEKADSRSVPQSRIGQDNDNIDGVISPEEEEDSQTNDSGC